MVTILTTPSAVYHRTDPAIAAAVRRIARAPEREHLPLLVEFVTEIQRAGVDLSLHWDCLCAALCEEIEE